MAYARVGFAGPKRKNPAGAGFFQIAWATQAAKLAATKSQLTRFQNASTYFGRMLR